MIASDAIVLPPGARDEAKAYLRMVGSDEDALIDRLIKAAAELAERFTGQVLLARTVRETVAVPAGSDLSWLRLARAPVRAITGVEAVGEGFPEALAAEDYAVDIDSNGDGWIRLLRRPATRCVAATYEAGLSAEWTGVPESIRQGVVRLAAHLFANRDRAEAPPPPAAVTALWRPWRRMRLG